MQDNPHTHIEEGFVDRSWESMATALDKVLPVQSELVDRVATTNYKNILLGLLLGILISIMGFSYYLTHQIPATQLTRETFIYKNIPVVSIESDKKQYIAAGNKNNYNVNNGFSSDSLDFQENRRNNISKIGLSNKDINPNKSVSKKIADTNIEPVSKRLQYLDSHVAMDNMKSLSISTIQDDEASIDTPKRPIRYNLGLLTLVANALDYTGYGFSTGLDIPIGNKFAINTGLAVNFISRDYYFLPPIDRSVKALDKIDTENTSSYYQGLQSFNQIYFPLNFNYTLTKGLSINSGVKVRYTYSETINNELVVANNVRSRVSESDYYSNTTIGFSAGFKYNLGSNFSILLDSEWGMGSLVDPTLFSAPKNRKYDLNMINFGTNYSF